MKKLVGMILSVMFIQAAHASDAPNINIKISGAANDAGSFVCVSHAECENLAASSQIKSVPMEEAGSISNIAILDAMHRAIYAQKLPASCQVAVNNGQTLTISGQAVNGGTRINNLRCSIS